MSVTAILAACLLFSTASAIQPMILQKFTLSGTSLEICTNQNLSASITIQLDWSVSEGNEINLSGDVPQPDGDNAHCSEFDLGSNYDDVFSGTHGYVMLAIQDENNNDTVFVGEAQLEILQSTGDYSPALVKGTSSDPSNPGLYRIPGDSDGCNVEDNIPDSCYTTDLTSLTDVTVCEVVNNTLESGGTMSVCQDSSYGSTTLVRSGTETVQLLQYSSKADTPSIPFVQVTNSSAASTEMVVLDEEGNPVKAYLCTDGVCEYPEFTPSRSLISILIVTVDSDNVPIDSSNPDIQDVALTWEYQSSYYKFGFANVGSDRIYTVVLSATEESPDLSTVTVDCTQVSEICFGYIDASDAGDTGLLKLTFQNESGDENKVQAPFSKADDTATSP